LNWVQIGVSQIGFYLWIIFLLLVRKECEWVIFILLCWFLFLCLILFFFSLIPVAFFTLMERQILGRFHLRLGPKLVGPVGLFQPFRDVIKLFCRGEGHLRFNQWFSWFFSSFLSVFLYFLYLISYPLGGGISFVENSFLILICFLRVRIYFFLYRGFYSGRNYSWIGSYRSVSQMISYEVILMFIFVIYFF